MIEIPPIYSPPMVSVQGGSVARPPQFKELRQRCYRDFELFVKEFFPHYCRYEMSEMHRRFCEIEEKPFRRGRNEAVAAPRGNAKSTFRTLFKPLHAIVYGYYKFIVVLGSNDAEATGKLKDIRAELLFNDHLIEVYGKLLDAKAAQSDFTTTNGVRIIARGRGGQVRGVRHGAYRPDLIIADDIESLESCNTPEQRQKMKDWFYKDVMGAGSSDGTTTISIVGTILHQESLLSDLLRAPAWHGVKYQAVKRWPSNMALWDRWREIYSDLMNEDRIKDAQAFYEANKEAMLEGCEVLWPDGENFYKLQEYIVKFGLASFYSEKQNDPFDPERQILDPDKAKRFDIVTPDSPRWPSQWPDAVAGEWAIVGDDIAPILNRDLNVIAFHDPALAESNRDDYGAIVVCAQDAYGYIYVVDAWVERRPPSTQIVQAHALCQKYGASILYLEEQGFQKLLRPLYDDESERCGFKPRIVGVTQHTNKQQRISTLEPWFSNGWLRMSKNLPAVLIDQIRLFPTTHDDGPDALQGCVSRLKRPGGVSVSQQGESL